NSIKGATRVKIIGLDIGSKTIGVAVSDAFGWTAQGIKTIYWNEADITSADDELKAMMESHEIGKAVIGLPKNMNGSIGERGKASQTFAEHVEKVFKIAAVLWDERLTSMAAERILLEADVSR